MRADDLLRHIAHLSKVGAIPGTNPIIELPAGDAELEAIAGAVRLCHFLAAVERDHNAIRDIVPPDDVEVGGAGGPSVEESSGLVKRMASDWMAELEFDEENRTLLAGY